jgi:mono/diheme cytochrome c family protein
MHVLSLLVVAGLGGLQAQDMATGEAIFNSNCAICHGNDGRGARGPNLRGSLRNGNQDSEIEAVIRDGLTGTAMPKFKFEDDELKSVVMYIQSWRRGAANEAGRRPDSRQARLRQPGLCALPRGRERGQHTRAESYAHWGVAFV